MSTARTNVGCLAEDYPKELADICVEWAANTRTIYTDAGVFYPQRVQLMLDVADSFIRMMASHEDV